MKKTFVCLFSLVLIFVSCKNTNQNSNGYETVTEPYTTTNVGDGTFSDASVIAKNMKLGLNLGDTMEAYKATNCTSSVYKIPDLGDSTSAYETCWDAPITTQEIIDGIKAAGFNTIRIPVFWGNMMKDDGNWNINLKLIDRVREIVDYCFNDDLYVIINIHHFDEYIIRRHSLDECETIFKNLWTQIATYFKNYSEKLVFEGYNEYLGGQQFDESGNLVDQSESDAYKMTNTLNQAFVDAVRATGGNNSNRVLIASGYWTNIDLTSSKDFCVPVDSAENKLMVSVHYVDNAMYWSKKIGTQTWIDYIESQSKLLKNAFTDKGIPVFMGETCAIYPSSNINSSALSEYKTSSACLKYVLERLVSYGFVPVIWDTEVSIAFYSRADKKIRDEANQEVIKAVAESFEK